MKTMVANFSNFKTFLFKNNSMVDGKFRNWNFCGKRLCFYEDGLFSLKVNAIPPIQYHKPVRPLRLWYYFFAFSDRFSLVKNWIRKGSSNWDRQIFEIPFTNIEFRYYLVLNNEFSLAIVIWPQKFQAIKIRSQIC